MTPSSCPSRASRLYACMVLLNFALTLAFLSLPAAATPPGIVFRVTIAPPDRVFAEGFPNQGTIEDVLLHVSGLSCHGGDTAFVATTQSYAFAMEQVVNDLLTADVPVAEIYLYRIRASDNFYSADASLREASRLTNVGRYLSFANAYRHQEEWIAYHGVPASQVSAVEVYRRAGPEETGLVTRIRETANTHYVAADTRASDQTFVRLDGEAARSNVAMVAPSLTHTHVSTCFACEPLPRPAETRGRPGDLRRSAEARRCPSFVIHMSDRPATVIDPITGTLVRRYVPWATHQHQVGGSLVEYPSDCVVQVGTRESGGTEEGERITVDCANLRGSSRFGVVLDAGGPAGQWISALYRDGLRGRPWERSASQISMINGDYSMRFHRHAIFEVFGGAHETWWSSIIVVPYFPDIWSPEQVDNPQVCFFRDAAFSVSQFCLRAGGAERALVGLHNDSISSISGDPSLRYQICVDSGFQGACQILSGFYDEELLLEYGMQDTISSVRVCSKEPRRMTQGAPDNRGFMGDVLAQYNPEVNAIQFFRLRLPGSYPPPPLRSGFNAAWLSLPNYDECG